MNVHFRLCAVLLLFAAVGAFADAKPELTLDALGHAPVSAASNQILYFTDESAVFAVALASPKGSATPRLGEGWWKRLSITVRSADAVVGTFSSKNARVLEARVRGRLVEGTPDAHLRWPSDQSYVRIAVDGLHPGDYEGVAELPLPDGQLVRSYVQRFGVRDGYEDDATRRVYLRLVASRTKSYAEYKPVMAELRKLEPTNAALPEEMAVRSLNVAPPEETLALFRDARTLAEQGARIYREKAQAAPDRAESAHVDEVMEYLSTFEKLYPAYKANFGRQKLAVIPAGGRMRFAWFSDAGALIGLVDPRDPSVVREVKPPKQ